MNTVGMCALLGVMSGAGPEAPTPESAMTLKLTIPESESAPELEAFLRERAGETWDVSEEAPARFEVVVDWPAQAHLVVRVQEAGRELARRQVEVTDPGAAKLTVWLVVKSTINRALLEGLPEEETAATEPKVEPVVEEAVEAIRESRAIEPPPRPTWGLGLLLVGTVSRVGLANFGPALMVWLNPSARLVITLEAGYRISPDVNLGQGSKLTIHYVPMTMSAGWQLDVARTWTAGAFATADLKIPVAETGTSLNVGLDVGGFVQTHLALTEHSHLLARLFAGARATRMRFLLDQGTVTEGPVLAGLALGALWQ